MDFKDVVDNVAKLIDTLPEKPILIGHSLGGLAVQKLVEMGSSRQEFVLTEAPLE